MKCTLQVLEKRKKMINLLIVEDDLSLNHALKIYFEKVRYIVFQAITSKEAEQIIEQENIDLIVADIGLPDQSGLVFAEKIRKGRNVPIIFLTAKDEERDILAGYDVGCEEYVTKPISPKILQKKIEAILKRQENDNILIYQALKIDYEKRRVWKEEQEINITDREWKILYLLAKNKGTIVTKEILLEKVWDVEGNFVDEHVVSVVINRLRKKIEDSTGEPVYIKNVFGVGYTFGE